MITKEFEIRDENLKQLLLLDLNKTRGENKNVVLDLIPDTKPELNKQILAVNTIIINNVENMTCNVLIFLIEVLNYNSDNASFVLPLHGKITHILYSSKDFINTAVNFNTL